MRALLKFRTTARLFNSAKSTTTTASAAVASEGTKFEPICTQKGPYVVTLEEGKKYGWCTCGLSEKQPFCDGKHKGTGMKSLKFDATPELCNKEVYLCGCRKTKNPPFCDGSHSTISE